MTNGNVNKQTRQVVQGERVRLRNVARGLSSAAAELNVQGFLSEFDKAKLSNAKGSDLFSASSFAGKFKGVAGVTEDDLKLSSEAVSQLSEDTEAGRKKKKALSLRFAIDTFAKEVSEKQAAGLWQQHILLGELYKEGEETGLSDANVSVEDLQRLQAMTQDYAVLDKSHLPKSVNYMFKDGKPHFDIGRHSTDTEIASVVNTLAASGSQSVDIYCALPEHVDVYRRMARGAFKQIMLNGHNMRMNVKTPDFLTKQGQGSMNDAGEPAYFFDRAKYKKARALNNFWQDVARNMPSSVGKFSDPAARFGEVFAGLEQAHKKMFMKFLLDDPDLRPSISKMAEYYIRTGEMDNLISLKKDFNHAVEVTGALSKAAKKTLKKTFSEGVGQAIEQAVQSGLTDSELAQSLDGIFEHTRSAYRNPNINFASQAVKDAEATVALMVQTMKPEQLGAYAKHLVETGGLQEDARAGMVMAHSTDRQHLAFTKAYLTAVQAQACEAEGVDAALEGEDVAAQQAALTQKYERVGEQVNAAAQSLLIGTKAYTARTAMPNAQALDSAVSVGRTVVEGLAMKRIGAVAERFETSGIHAAAIGDYAQESVDKYNSSAETARVLDAQEFTRGGGGLSPSPSSAAAA